MTVLVEHHIHQDALESNCSLILETKTINKNNDNKMPVKDEFTTSEDL